MCARAFVCDVIANFYKVIGKAKGDARLRSFYEGNGKYLCN
jgi:hypothetical protein